MVVGKQERKLEANRHPLFLAKTRGKDQRHEKYGET